MTTEITTISSDIIESLVINGDLSKLTPTQKVEYYQKYCITLGLNPITQPFQILKLNGKERLYCGREGVAQLSKVHEVSHEILSTETMGGIFIVKCKAIAGNRSTVSTGCVTIGNLQGDSLCNAFMKAETKAKRRATLDLLGLGMLDETEIETIPNAQTVDVPHEEVKLPPLTSKQFESCIKGINEGKAEDVREFLKKYTCTTEQANAIKLAIDNYEPATGA